MKAHSAVHLIRASMKAHSAVHRHPHLIRATMTALTVHECLIRHLPSTMTTSLLIYSTHLPSPMTTHSAAHHRRRLAPVIRAALTVHSTILPALRAGSGREDPTVGGYTRGGTPQTPDRAATNPQTIRRALDLAPASEHAALLSDKTDWNRSTRVEQASTPSFDYPDQETMRRIDSAQSASKYSSLKSAARTASSWVSIARRQSESPPVLTNSAGLMAGSHSAFEDISPVATVTVTPEIPKRKKKKGEKLKSPWL